MKMLAFVDTHEDPKAFKKLKGIIKKEKIDVAACLGDFTIFGRSTEKMLKQLNAFGIPVVLIHGNHEDEEEILELLPKFKNIHWAHAKMLDLCNVRFFGFGGGGFSSKEPELERLERKFSKKFHERTIVLSHAPPYDTTLDEVEPGWHVGNESLTELIKRRLPLVTLSGHIHQCFHKRDTIFGATVINPGPDGEIIEVPND